MSQYKAVLFDLDDTLLNRHQAVDKMFFLIIETYYENVKESLKEQMLHKFKECDRRGYGDNDKVKVLESFFNEYPPKNRLPRQDIQTFWNDHFPHCFSITQSTLDILNTIKMHAKIGMITNGATQRQKAKIMNTKLNSCFDSILISEEVGISKPDERIFKLALKKLNVIPEDTLFVGDDIEKDIGGCQNANIKGIWFNPNKKRNVSEIKPYAEIDSFHQLLGYLT